MMHRSSSTDKRSPVLSSDMDRR